MGLIVFGLYWFYDFCRTDDLSSWNMPLPTFIFILGAVLIYLTFEEVMTRLKEKKQPHHRFLHSNRAV